MRIAINFKAIYVVENTNTFIRDAVSFQLHREQLTTQCFHKWNSLLSTTFLRDSLSFEWSNVKWQIFRKKPTGGARVNFERRQIELYLLSFLTYDAMEDALVAQLALAMSMVAGCGWVDHSWVSQACLFAKSFKKLEKVPCPTPLSQEPIESSMVPEVICVDLESESPPPLMPALVPLRPMKTLLWQPWTSNSDPVYIAPVESTPVEEDPIQEIAVSNLCSEVPVQSEACLKSTPNSDPVYNAPVELAPVEEDPIQEIAVSNLCTPVQLKTKAWLIRRQLEETLQPAQKQQVAEETLQRSVASGSTRQKGLEELLKSVQKSLAEKSGSHRLPPRLTRALVMVKRL